MVFKCAGLFQLLHKSLEGGPGAWLSAERLEQSLSGNLVGLNEDCGQCRPSLGESPQALIIPHHRKAIVHTGRAKLLLSHLRAFVQRTSSPSTVVRDGLDVRHPGTRGAMHETSLQRRVDQHCQQEYQSDEHRRAAQFPGCAWNLNPMVTMLAFRAAHGSTGFPGGTAFSSN
jgi:hypothetical protein